MTIPLLSGIKLKTLLHLVVWAGVFILPTYLLYGDSPRDNIFIYSVWIQLVFYAVLFYLSYSLLAQRYFFSGKKTAYFTIIGLMILILTLFLDVLNHQLEPIIHESREGRNPPMELFEKRDPAKSIPPPRHQPPAPAKNMPLFNFLLTSCLVTALSLGLRFSEKLNLNEKIRKDAEKEKLHTELALLKHQINPHFLFNTLNSIYSLALIQSDKTARAVMMLSDMMHYVISDVANETVPLELELEYVVQYVELQKIRLSANVDVQMNITGDPKPYEIPPMILVPFIENAFQYGTSSHENTSIRIDINTGDRLLAFKVSNQVFPGREKAETFGIGIRNTRQRLNLMYPGSHTLDISNNDREFVVTLEITLT